MSVGESTNWTTTKTRRAASAGRTDRVTGRRLTGPGGRWRPPGSSLPITRSAGLDPEFGTPVLILALVGVLGTHRPLLPVGDRRQAVLRDSVGLEIVHRRLRPPIAERQVVLGGAALVAVAFDAHERVRVLLQPRRVVRQRIDRIGSERGLVEVEVDRLQLRHGHEIFAPRSLGWIARLRLVG